MLIRVKFNVNPSINKGISLGALAITALLTSAGGGFRPAESRKYLHNIKNKFVEAVLLVISVIL